MYWDQPQGARTRSQSFPMYVDCHFSYDRDSPIPTHLGDANETRLAVIKDDTIIDVTGRMWQYNPVDHWSFSFKPQFTQVPTVIPCPGGPGNNYRITVSPVFIPKQISYQDIWNLKQAGYGFTTSSGEFQTFVDDAFWQISQGLKGDMSLLQTIVNVFQLGRLAKQIIALGPRFFRVVRLLARESGYTYKHLLSLSARELITIVSDLNLGYQFGIMTTLRDTEEVLGLVERVRKSMRWLQDNDGKIVPVRYSRSYRLSYPDHLWYTDTRLLNCPCYIREFQTKVNLTCVAKMFVFAPQTKAQKVISAFVEGSGLNRAPELAWDLVPFSFVVDWFIPIQRWLRNNVVQTLTSPSYVDGGISVKTETTGKLHYQGGGGNINHLAGTFLLKEYRRRNGVPVGNGIRTNFSSLHPKQLAILASLAGQRV